MAFAKISGSNDEFMTVGEVADLVGVTVRSIQYYDQQGILSPSAKGPQNQRLYTPDDVRKLYCVLCLKYAGLSLAQIRESLGNDMSAPVATRVFLDALSETEDAFSALLRRYATLRSLAEMAAQTADEPNWAELAESIERFQGDGKYFWRLSCIYDDGAPQPEPEEFDKGRVVTQWHSLIAEALANMSTGEPLDSEKSMGLAERFLKLSAEDAVRPKGQSFLLLENAPTSHHECGVPFDGMRQEVNDYLAKIVATYRASHDPSAAQDVD